MATKKDTKTTASAKDAAKTKKKPAADPKKKVTSKKKTPTRSVAKTKKSAVKKITENEIPDIDPAAKERGDIPMSLIGHLDEFRSRFLVSLVTIVVITLVSFFFSDQLLYIINKPYLATGLKLNVFNLIDGFLLRLKSAFIAGILLGFPIIIYEVWKYVVPAIERKDRMFSRATILIAVVLFYLGVTLTYFALPLAIKALLSFTPPEMTNTINASQYLNFVLIFCLAIGAVFELPIVILILTRIGIVTPSFLISKRKYAIVLIWILAAIITPTVDPLTQSLVAVPLMILYEISIVISKMVVLRKKKKELKAG